MKDLVLALRDAVAAAAATAWPECRVVAGVARPDSPAGFGGPPEARITLAECRFVSLSPLADEAVVEMRVAGAWPLGAFDADAFRLEKAELMRTALLSMATGYLAEVFEVGFDLTGEEKDGRAGVSLGFRCRLAVERA